MDLANYLKNLSKIKKFLPVLPEELHFAKPINTSSDSLFWQKMCRLANLKQPCWSEIAAFLQSQGAKVAIGPYAEVRRDVYIKNQELLHLGSDLIVMPGTPVYAPLAGSIREIKFNNSLGDYGTLVVIEHDLEDCKFFTLYGHLFCLSCSHLKPLQRLKAGELIGRVGDEKQNGGWPPHLHFQISSAQLINRSIFTGAAELAIAKEYLQYCPDPNLILQMEIT